MAEYIHYVYNICQSYTLHTFPTLCSHILKCNRSHHEKKYSSLDLFLSLLLACLFQGTIFINDVALSVTLIVYIVPENLEMGLTPATPIPQFRRCPNLIFFS